MNFALSEDQKSLVELARKILQDRATHERLKAIEASADGIDRELWRALAEANLVGACLPEEFGGSGLGFFELCLVLEEVGRTVAPVPYFATVVLGALPLAQFGSAEQKKSWLPGVISGETLLTAALEEPDSDDLERPSTRAERDGAGWRLTGTKLTVPIAQHAARVLVPAATGQGRIGWFWIDPNAPGVKLEPQRVTSREPVATLTLRRTKAKSQDLLGTIARGREIARWIGERAVTGLCAMQVGVADRALRMTAAYTSERKQFDRPIGSFQAVHQRAGDAYVNIEAMRLTMQQAAFLLAEGRPAALAVSVAKIWAADGGNFSTYAAQHLHGGIGVDLDYPLHRSYLWTRQIELTLGSAARHLERIGEVLASTPPAGQ
ncbi:MAG TPA: acyl-CoA dehydrogenase family protein [Myxococcota bacterium]|nr:acyl-CoA dehydrogenase family protein [Myxococcota bacterium]